MTRGQNTKTTCKPAHKTICSKKKVLEEKMKMKDKKEEATWKDY